jgi:1,4-dihydroxy-2-naphthoate octaprenyltransferase
MQHSAKEMLKSWIDLSRPAFHAVGIMPFILGTIIACKFTSSFDPAIFILGLFAVILIMLSTYHAGEYYDYRGDVISNLSHQNRFAGGTRILPCGKLPPAVPFWTSIIALAMAGVIGIILQFAFKTGPCTLLLGFLGAFPGFFYSAEPIRLVKRGLGEISIGFCYGWLPVATAYYLQTGTIHPLILWLGIPIGLSIFNVILLNEFPDYEADRATDKKNLLYRIGKQKGAALYIAFSLLASGSMMLAPLWGVPFRAVYFYLPFLIISLYIAALMFRKKYENGQTLELLCGWNIAVNLGTSLAFILAYLFN